MQGIWKAHVPASYKEPVLRPLYPDAGSGVIFNFSGQNTLGRHVLEPGVNMLPVNDEIQSISLSPGATLAGVRFHPAVGYQIFQQRFNTLEPYSETMKLASDWQLLYQDLVESCEFSSYIDKIEDWLLDHLDCSEQLPKNLAETLDVITQGEPIGCIEKRVDQSLRQIERTFHTWLGITPKKLQRLLRVKNTIGYLRQNKNADLADAAAYFGYSDQAHMNREFRCFTGTTPKRILGRDYSQYVS